MLPNHLKLYHTLHFYTTMREIMGIYLRTTYIKMRIDYTENYISLYNVLDVL